MAGKVAKYGNLSMSFGTAANNSEYHDEARSGSGNRQRNSKLRSGNIMEEYLLIDEDVIIKSLGIEVECEKALRYLDRQFCENNHLLIFQDKLSLFRGLAQALSTRDNNVRIECTKLIAKIIPQLGPDLEQCLQCVLPKIVSNIGNVTGLQKESIQTLHICMKHSIDVYQILKVIAENGIKHDDQKTRKQIILTFPTLLFPEFKNEDFFDVVIALVQNLADTSTDNTKVLKTLSQVKKFVGVLKFASYINDLPSPLQSLYNEMLMLSESNILMSNRSTPSLLHEHSISDLSHPGILSPSGLDQTDLGLRSVPDFGKSGYFGSSSMKNSLGRGFKVRTNYLTPARSPEMLQTLSPHFEFGFVSKSIIENLSSTDNKFRQQAVEDLQATLGNMREISPLRQNIIPMVSLLQPVIEDNNYRISCGALQALGMIIQKVGPDIMPYVKLICTTAAKRIGSKDVIRAECMKVLLGLEEVTDAGSVLDHFWSKLQHKQAKIREETLNLVTASLLKFPFDNSNIGLLKLSNNVAPALVDPKPRVRQAALECLAALGTYYDTNSPEMKTVVAAIDRVELGHDNASGIMSAVLARLVRKQLPRLKENMLVEYAVIPKTSAHINSPQSADIRWVLSAARSSSTTSQSSLSHFTSSLNDSFINPKDPSDSYEDASNTRHPSARKRGVFPWAREDSTSEKHPSSAPVQTQRNNRSETHAPPLKPRATWGPESQEKIAGQQQAKLRLNRANETTSGTAGGYLEIHQRKQANAINKEQLTHVGAPVPQRKQLDGESTGLHSAPMMGRNMSLSDAGGGYLPSFGSSDTTSRQPRTNLGSVKAQNDVLSNSCPTTFFDENSQMKKFNKSPKRSPLVSVANEAVGQKPANDLINEPDSPIHLKPQLARSSAKRRGSPNGNKPENQLSVHAPLKLKNSASPRLDRIADNPTVDNVRPLIKQNRTYHQTSESKLGSSGGISDLLDPPLSIASGYTPSGLQQKPNQASSNAALPLAVIRHPSHQMKSSTGQGSAKTMSNGHSFSDNDTNSNVPFKQKEPILNKYPYDHYPVDTDATNQQPKSRPKPETHGTLRSTKSFPSEKYSSDLITHPRLVQKASAPVQSDTPRTAPQAGVREEEEPYKSSMDLIRHSAQRKRNQMQRSLSSGKELNAMAGLDGSFTSTLPGSASGRAAASEGGSNGSSEVLSPISNKTGCHASSPVRSTSRDSLENFFINGYQSTQNRRYSRTDSEPSSMYSTDTGYVSTFHDPRKLRKSSKIEIESSPFMTKPSIARPGSGKANANVYSPNGAARENSSTDAPSFKYSPNSGVSFSTQKTKSNVSVVGYGYSLRSPSSSETTVSGSSPIATPTSLTISPGLLPPSSKPSLASLGSNQSSREKRRSQRGSSLGLAMTADDNFNVKGRAIRDTSSTNLSELPDYSPTPGKDEVLPWSNSNDSLSYHPPDAVYGKAVRHASASSDISNEESRESVPLSASLLANQLKKKGDLEKFRKKGKLKNQGSEQDLSLEEKLSGLNIDSKPPPASFNATGPLQPSKSKRKSRSPTSKVSPPRAASLDRRSGSRDSTALRTTTEILPCVNPESLLNEAIVGLQNRANSGEWEIICSHIHTFRRLASYHQEVLATRIKEVLFVLNSNVSNLRSQVSRAAVVCLTDVYTHLKKPAIDTDIEATTRTLLTAYGRNTGAFMQEEITKTLQYVVANVSSVKVLNALLTIGIGNRNTSVRDMTAQFSSLLVEKMGPGKALSGIKDTTDRIIVAASAFVTDPSQVTRYYGRCILQHLMTHQDFDKCVEKYLSQKQAQELKEAVQNIKTRGAGSIGSAGSRNQGSGVRRNGSTRGLSRTGNSANSERLPQISSSKSLSRRSTPAKPSFNDADQEEIRALCAKLSSGDINAKKEALAELTEKLQTNRPIIEENVVKIMDELRSLLTTANSKVNCLGLETVIVLIPELGNLLPPSDLVPTVCRLLVSKQQSTAQLAMRAVNEMLKHIDHMLLLQQFANCAMYSPGKTKQVCVEKLAALVSAVSARKPQSVERHVLPVLLSLLNEKHAANLKRETTILAKALHATMGDALLQYAEAKNVKGKILDMIES